MATTCSQLAFVFPGQGSQSLGMMADMANNFPIVGEIFSEASEILDYDLWQLTQDGPVADLNQTDKTQPAMLAAGVATWRIWQQQTDILPAIMAGHSLGEYTALVCSGAIGFSDAIALVRDRGRYMQEAVPAGEGAMAAILGLSDDQVRESCIEAAQGDVVAAVNFNAPGQVVIAGNTTAVLRAIDICKTAGAKRAIQLPVSVPSHCDLMKPAAINMKQRLDEISISSPNVLVVNNVDVKMSSTPGDIRDALVQQLYKPVRWVETITSMYNSNITTVIECGPGKVLVGLNKRINKDIRSLPITDTDSLQLAIDTLNVTEETT